MAELKLGPPKIKTFQIWTVPDGAPAWHTRVARL